MSLSDQMLDSGCASLVEVMHSEPIRILDGPDAGKTFFAVKEKIPDNILMTELGDDRRGKRLLRFRDSSGVPRFNRQCRVETEDGKKWTIVLAPQDGYLTTDFELQQITPKDS